MQNRRLISGLAVSVLLTGFFCLTTTVAARAASTAAPAASISLEQIMADPDWLGRPPLTPYWADDSRSIYYRQKRAGFEIQDLFQVTLDGVTRQVAEDVLGEADFEPAVLSEDRAYKAYIRHHDLYVKDLRRNRLQQLTRTVAEESRPRILHGEPLRVVFERDQLLFVRELDSGLEYQPVNLRLEDDPEAETDPLAEDERRLLDTIAASHRKKTEADQYQASLAELDQSRGPLPIYLGKGWEWKLKSLSPDGQRLLLALRSQEGKEKEKEARVPFTAYVADGGIADTRDARPLVGRLPEQSDRVLLVNTADDSVIELDFSGLPGMSEDPLAALKSAQGIEPGSRHYRIGASFRGQSPDDAVLWNPSGERLVLMVFSADQKDRWLVSVDPSGELELLDRAQDEAWVSWNFNEVGWIDEHRLYYQSEASGYVQIHVADLSAGTNAPVTEGEAEHHSVSLSRDRRYLYYLANPDHPGVTNVYRHDLRRSSTEQITRLEGRMSYALSPDGSRLLLNHSTATRPPELFVQRTDPAAEPRRLTQTVSEAFRAVDWVRPEVVAIPSSQQQRPIFSRVYDRGAGNGAGRPAVIFVHGAGYLQNAHKGWSSYFREFMFHTLLADRGYVVLDMDYRASAGYGRDWRTAIYRRMGEPELQDLLDGVNYLVANRNVDSERIGIYGGSYGGFMTLMALFKAPEVFAAGAALRPVTDWRYYNHWYTAAILNTPAVDPEAYRLSSPIEFAEGLERPLLIAHGMLDDNVLYQDSVRLAQRLIELGKTDWEMASYPVEPHGFKEPVSWLDEYRRVLALIEREIGGANPDS